MELRRVQWARLPRSAKGNGEYAEKQGFGKATITYRFEGLGDSRQRYWGTFPFPCCLRKVRHCAGAEDQLPVLLPEQVDITLQGGSPWDACRNCECQMSKCGGTARRETDTMDTSWIRPGISIATPATPDKPFDSALVNYWFPHRSIHRRS